MPKTSHSYRQHSSGKGFVEIDGKRIYLPGKWGSDESLHAYRDVLEEHRIKREAEKVRDSVEVRHAAMTVNEALVKFYAYAEIFYRRPDGTDTGSVNNFRNALRPLRERYGYQSLDSIGPTELKAIRQAWINEKLTRVYINTSVRKIVQFFRWCVGEEYAKPETLGKLRGVTGLEAGRSAAVDNEQRTPIPDKLFSDTLKHLRPTLADLLRVVRLTGCRPSEIARMRPMDLQADGDLLLYVPRYHKTQHHGKLREIVIGPRAAKIVKKYLKGRDHAVVVFSPADSERQRNLELRAKRKSKRFRPLKADPKGTASKQYRTASLNLALIRACKKHGLEQWSAGRLRHSMATQINKRFDMKAASAILGHSRAATTMRYASPDLELAKTVAREIG